MKALSNIKFLFQLFSVLFVCLSLGSLGAWENGNLPFFALLLQLSAFGSLAYMSFKMSALASRKRLRIRARHAASSYGKISRLPHTPQTHAS